MAAIEHDETWINNNRVAIVVVSLVALASSAAGLFNDFVYDDIPLIRDNARVHGLSHWMEIITRPYWPPPFVEQLYRPLAVLAMAVEYTIGNGSPLAFRLVSCLLYIVGSVVVYWLAAKLVSQLGALIAAVLFAAHPVHVEAVALGVNQGELIIGLLGAVMVGRYVTARRAGRVSAGDWIVLGACYALAALIKEGGFILPALLGAAELLLVGAPSLRARAASLWRGYALLAAIAFMALVVREVVLGGRPIGVVANAAFDGLGFGGRMLAMLEVVPIWFRLFIWPSHLQADYPPGDIAPPGLGAPEAFGFLLVCVAIGVVWTGRRRAPVVAFGAAWCIIGLLPVANIVPTGILVAERTLYLPSMGFLIAVAAAGDIALRRWPAIKARRLLVGVCAVVSVFGVARSIGRERVWNTAHLKIVKRGPL